ncbi:MAG: hypothetical protein NT029_07085 [Armatimonadetes bacterium]|nr:hypothetical protein [Armatimonadota bacterium]
MVKTLAATAALATVLLLAVPGCGGGSQKCGETKNRSGYISSSDRIWASRSTYADVYDFTACDDNDVTISMSSTDFDTYLILARRTGTNTYYVLDYDDDSGVGLNSVLSYRVTDGQTYSIIATTASVGATGDYDLSVSGSASNLETAQAGRGLVLPIDPRGGSTPTTDPAAKRAAAADPAGAAPGPAALKEQPCAR